MNSVKPALVTLPDKVDYFFPRKWDKLERFTHTSIRHIFEGNTNFTSHETQTLSNIHQSLKKLKETQTELFQKTLTDKPDVFFMRCWYACEQDMTILPEFV
jgi:hypothetical protein